MKRLIAALLTAMACGGVAPVQQGEIAKADPKRGENISRLLACFAEAYPRGEVCLIDLQRGAEPGLRAASQHALELLRNQKSEVPQQQTARVLYIPPLDLSGVGSEKHTRGGPQVFEVFVDSFGAVTKVTRRSDHTGNRRLDDAVENAARQTIVLPERQDERYVPSSAIVTIMVDVR